MDELIKNWTPLFAAGLAVQQLLEVCDAFLSALRGYEKHKKVILKLTALALGMFLATHGEFHALRAVGGSFSPLIDNLISGLIVSGGTESFNSLVKFLGYAKENRKALAATSTGAAGTLGLQQMQRK